MSSDHVNYMKRALQLAAKGAMTVAPNPLVGALIVKDGTIIAEGYHSKKGGDHAEVDAIKNSTGDLGGATLYCTLEPCCHTNKLTPPCTNLIIEKKFSQVVIASLDPNPEVSGKGVKALEKNGIKVLSGVLEKEAQEQNRIFFKNMKESLPYLKIKSAITLDGRMSSEDGDSHWISSEEARAEVHRDRALYDSIMVGVNTLRKDNPRLNTRMGKVVVKENKKIIVGDLRKEDLDNSLFSSGAEIINLFNKTSLKDSRILSIKNTKNWKDNLKNLFDAGIVSIYTEGGSTLLSSLIEEDIYDELTFYITQKIIGNGPSFFESKKNKKMSKAKIFDGVWRNLSSGEIVLEVKR